MKLDLRNNAGRLRRQLVEFRDDKSILPANRTTILDFDAYIASIGLSECRRIKYLALLRWLSKCLKKPFQKATKEDLMKVIRDLEATDLAEWTKADRKITTKRFYKWLKGNDEVYPDEVRWIKYHLKNQLVKLPEEIINEEEVKRLADAAEKPRDKAFIQCLYESGCRIAELVTLQVKNISFDEYGAILRVTGKTGDRRVRIVASAPALALWMDFHPFKSDPEAYLWSRKTYNHKNDRKPMSFSAVTQMLEELAEKADVKKRVNPHSFRHARATALANKLTEAQMKEYFGWMQSSDMASVYVHLSGRDVDNAILDVYGLRKESARAQEKFQPHVCLRCGQTGSPGSKLCTRCGYAFTQEVAFAQDVESKKQAGIIGQLMKDDEFKQLMLKKIVELNL